VGFRGGRVLFMIGLLVFTGVVLTGCGNYRERRTLRKAKSVLADEEKKIDDLVKVRGNLKRIIDMKIQAVNMLESADRILGRKYMDIGSYNLAKEALEEAESLKPYNPYIKKELGDCYYFLGKSVLSEKEAGKYFDISRSYFNKAIDIKPDFSEAYYSLGLLLFFGFNDVEGAIDKMKMVLKFEPDHVDAHFALGRFYYEIDELGKALNEYIILTRILPKSSSKRKKAEENIMRINSERGVGVNG